MKNNMDVGTQSTWTFRRLWLCKVAIGAIVFMSLCMTIDTANAQQGFETLQLKNGEIVEGTILRADLNIIAVRRDIGGVRLLTTAQIASMRLSSQGESDLELRFDDWIDGATAIERDGRSLEIKDWIEAADDEPVVDVVMPFIEELPPEFERSRPELYIYSIGGEEGVRPATIRLQLSEPATIAISVAYATSDGTARAGVDYAQLKDTLTIQPGVKTSSIEVPIFNDQLAEEDEFLQFNIDVDPELVDLQSASAIKANIVDND
ncbi:MAG: Calx-beta domain-containing protein [Geminicoccales bacterium]